MDLLEHSNSAGAQIFIKIEDLELDLMLINPLITP